MENLSLDEWNHAVSERANRIFLTKRVYQLSEKFDAPQFARDWMALASAQGDVRDLHIKVWAERTDAKGRPLLHKKTKKPMYGWSHYPIRSHQ